MPSKVNGKNKTIDTMRGRNMNLKNSIKRVMLKERNARKKKWVRGTSVKIVSKANNLTWYLKSIRFNIISKVSGLNTLGLTYKAAPNKCKK